MPNINGVIAEWITEVTRRNALPTTCRAVLVGLFEGQATYTAYLVGSDEYDPDDDDWACNQDFTPEPRYVDTGVSTDIPWESFLQDAVTAVREVLAGPSNTLLHQSPHVSVGFDDGDLVHVK